MELSEQDFLQVCKNRIEEEYHLGNSDRLKQRDFEYLIDLIEETSGTKLSISTLKRLWRDTSGQNPHPATLDALVSILGYKNWLEFKVDIASQVRAPESEAKVLTGSPGAGPLWIPSLLKKRKPAVIAGMALVMLALLVISFTSKHTGEPADFDDVVFGVKNTVSAGVPNTVIFNYDLAGIQADSFFIQQDWNPNNRAKIDPSAGYYTSVYYFPGFHKARLLADGTVLKTDEVFIRTKGWLAAALHRDAQERPIYFDADSSRGGMLSIRKETLLGNGVDPDRFEGSGFFNIGGFGTLDAHNFSCETRFRFREFVNVPCPFMQFTIHTEANIYVVQLSSMGCVGELELRIGERSLTGKDSDLSAFGTDVSEWQELSMTVEDKHATIFLNGEHIIEIGFNGNFGNIVGVDYRFTGMGDVDYLRFKKPDNTLVFEDNF